ncbi:hypothetical protein BC937DRAFT_89335, partial [Endogone sp. FLAS-F59071]
YITLILVLLLYNSLINHCKTTATSKDLLLVNAANAAKEKFLNYYNRTDTTSSYIFAVKHLLIELIKKNYPTIFDDNNSNDDLNAKIYDELTYYLNKVEINENIDILKRWKLQEKGSYSNLVQMYQLQVQG